MFHGLRTVIYGVPDSAVAKQWYSAMLGIEPYYDSPYYVGFSVGGFELGLDPNAPTGTEEGAGPVAYWGVTNADAAMTRLLDMGATLVEKVHDVGDGIHMGKVRDPYGNVLGFIENPHFALP